MEAPSAPVLRYGLTEIHAPTPASSAQVDVVFVHGLNGDPKKTWTSKSGNVFWPEDLLPSFIHDFNVRVLVYGYDADILSFATKGTGVTKDKIHNHAERLVADLFANRRIRKASERPIIFVAHSLGGLVVKRALIYSTEITGLKTEHLRSVAVSTYGVFFLGTPHKGSNLGQWGSYLEWLSSAVVPKKVMDSQPYLVEALKTNSEVLQNIDRQFSMIMDKYHLFFFHEAKPTDFKGTHRFIVDEESAAPTLPDVERASIQADHSSMCKFENEGSPGFDLIVDGIQRYAEEAPSVTRQRWLAEKQERLNQKLRKAKELVPGAISDIKLSDNGFVDPPSSTTSPSQSMIDVRESSSPKQASATSSSDFLSTSRPAEPFFIVPPGFRMNSVFVGMQRELHLLEQYLFGPGRELGTTCVLVHGHPGAGKSHLVRQYIYEHREKFSGGIFWINAHLIGEVENDFWQIAQKVVAKVSPEMMLAVQDSGRQYTDTVREWFENRQEWLIVLDGVAVERDEDLEKLHRFIPESTNSNIVYISRSSRFEAMDSLLNPTAVKVRSLREAEGRELLFRELHIDKPRPAQIKSATELVNKIGGLPLAINAIAKRIADTHVPIEKYSMKSYSTDPILGGTFRVVMDDLRKNRHTEALNLISIICFFGPHIPVEMIHLGLKILKSSKIEIMSSEGGEEPDLNITLGILMRHALVERNEPEDDSSLSGSRDSLVDPEPIDTLRMHTVIQRFCSDSLNASKRLPAWLNHACQLFICSYYEADTRIRSRIEPARVSDYRQYSIHGEQLRQHTLNYESKRQPLVHMRTQINSVLADIGERIRSMEPQSSQESVVQKEFQCSIFDRTNTSPSSTNSQSDDSSQTRSSYSLVPDSNKSIDPGTRRESGSSAGIIDAYRSSATALSSSPARHSDTPDQSLIGLPTSQSMQRNPSDAPTIRPSERKQTSCGSIGKLRSPLPLATVNTDAALGSMINLDAANLASSRTALSSLTNTQGPKESSLQGLRSFWSRTFSHHRPELGAPSGEYSGESEEATSQSGARFPRQVVSGPSKDGYRPPAAPLAPSRGRMDRRSPHQLHVGGQWPIRSHSLRSKSPLAAPTVSPSYDARYWENLAPGQIYTATPVLNPVLPLVPHASPLQRSQLDVQQSVVLGPSLASPQFEQQTIPITPSASHWQAPSTVVTSSINTSSAPHVLSSLSNQTSGLQTIHNVADVNSRQQILVQSYEHQPSATDPTNSKNISSTLRQSPRIESVKLNESPHLRLDGSPGQTSLNFASTNSSPTVPPRMFSSMNSDVPTTSALGEKHQNTVDTAMAGSSTTNWIEPTHQALQPKTQSAPLGYSQFSSPASMISSPPLSTCTTLTAPPNPSVTEIPVSLATQASGLGIGKVPEAIPTAGLAIVPPSDPRRRLRAREGRLTERDVNILVRQPSEVDHPLAPKEELPIMDGSPAILTLNAPDGHTVLASTNLRAWKPVERNVGTRSSAPYPESSRIPPSRNVMTVDALIADLETGHRRRRSAPESPGWNAAGDSAGWLGQG